MESCDVPESFNFPYKPYDIQVDFMKTLFSSLEYGKIGIFESPTGTGKSLSIICGTLTWLKDYERRRAKKLEEELSQSQKTQDEGNDWFAAQTKNKEKEEGIHELKKRHEFMKSREKRAVQLKEKLKRKRSEDHKDLQELLKSAKLLKVNKENTNQNETDNNSDDDDDDLLANIEECQETANDHDNDADEMSNYVTKIYYCSRTHSQLSQFVHEIQKTFYSKEVQVVTLGSRQNTCINETVLKLQSLSLINDKCKDLQKKTGKRDPLLEGGKSRKKTSGCPYFRQHAMAELRDTILAEVRDIEDIVLQAKDRKACPYYSSRYGVPEAELVVVPYNVLLHEDIRKACGINLKDNIVIIDEAHNLLETISDIHSAKVTGTSLIHAYVQLKQYMDRFHSRLNPQNLMFVKQILFILSALIKYVGGTVNGTLESNSLATPAVSVHNQNEFLSAAGIDNINLFNVLKYCKDSNIARKLYGFSNKYNVTTKQEAKPLTKYLQQLSGQTTDEKEDGTKDRDIIVGSPLMSVIEFLRALTNPSTAGRIIVNKGAVVKQSSMTFMLLNPALYFKDAVREARSIILAGGTMHPISEFIEQLFVPAGVPRERIVQYSCGHVIPDSNLLALSLSTGPGGNTMDFTYNNRNNPMLLDDLGRLLINISLVIPGGIVCFFPSYEYEQQVYAHWEKTGMILRLNAKKRVFREPRKSSQVEKVLADYAKVIRGSMKSQSALQNGAMLFSIVGGKMSEGINFSDELGRCVVMIGLPYPNTKSPELKEKMDFLNGMLATSPDGKKPGSSYCENLCMRAVNQSIGRAIRHQNDYATVLLLDGRYQRPSIESALPGWISSCLQRHDKFGLAFAAIRHFFAKKKELAL